MDKFTKERYEGLFIYFKYIYFKNGWDKTFGEKTDLNELFQLALIMDYKLNRENITIDELISPYIFDSRFANEAQYKSWLAKVFINFLKDYYRNRNKDAFRNVSITNEDSSERDFESSFSTPEETIHLENLKNMAINTASSKFMRKECEVLSLYLNEGKTYEELSRILDRSVSGVWRDVERILKELKKTIEKDLPDDKFSDDDRTKYLRYFLEYIEKVDWDKILRSKK
jgi:RNA polymerase sigma factor (sigma-70 family)